MFSGVMTNAWIVATVVAIIAGVVGFFVVLRSEAFAAHAIPNGAFAGAAGAALVGVNTLVGLAIAAVLTALGIGSLGRSGKRDAATALALVMMLALGSAFLSRTSEYSQELFSLLFGEVLGVSGSQILPVAGLGALCLVALAVLFRPLLLSSMLPEVAQAHGIKTGRMEMIFLLVLALATAMTVPVVGALLIFSLMIGPPAAARAFTSRPLLAIAVSVVISLVTVWTSIASSYATNWPIGFYVGMFSAVGYGVGILSGRKRRSTPTSSPPAGHEPLAA